MIYSFFYIYINLALKENDDDKNGSHLFFFQSAYGFRMSLKTFGVHQCISGVSFKRSGTVTDIKSKQIMSHKPN